MFNPRLLALCLFLLLSLSGCALFEPPPTLELPTPIPTAAPFDSPGTAPLVQDPVSDIVAAVDPSIASLLEGEAGISRQNLFAYVQTLVNFNTRHSLSDTQSPNAGIGASRDWLFAEFSRVGNGRLIVEYEDFSHTVDGIATNQRNVIATLPGSGNYGGVIILTAHYDSRSIDPFNGEVFAPGANDNASGVALLLEAARVLSARSWNQTIIFAAFAAEEQNTAGSRFFVQRALLERNLQIDAVMNYDIVGGRFGIPQSLRAFADGSTEDGPQQLTRYINQVGALYTPQFPVTVINALDRPDRYGDQREFLNGGVTAIRFTESEEDPTVQHTSDDTPDLLDYDYLVKVTQLAVATVANAAGAPPRPAPPLIAPMADPGSFILNWTPDAQAAAYAISFRPIGATEYAPFRYVRGNEAGNVVLTGFDPNTIYAVSIAPLDVNGRLGFFSAEVLTTTGQ